MVKAIKMNKFSSIFLLVVLATICTGRYLPKPEFVKNTPKEWTETAKKLDMSDDQTAAAIDLMQFIIDRDSTSAEMDTNEEWRKTMINKCMKLADFDKIDELKEYVGDKKWSDVKDKDFATKREFWADKYKQWDCEMGKMKALKNMCIVITEHEQKKEFVDVAKEVGLKEEQFEPTARMIWEFKVAKEPGTQKSILADNCEMLNTDGKMLDVDEKFMTDKKWSELADKDITTKMEFWWKIMETADCKVAKLKSVKNVCVLFMNEEERKKIEGWAKEAGMVDDEVKKIIDLEMRMNMVTTKAERRSMMMMNFEKLGNDKTMLEPTMTKDDSEKLKSVENKDWMDRMHFWAEKYMQSTGADRMKSLKNVCIIMMEAKEKENKDKKRSE